MLSKVTFELQRNWRWALLMGVAASVFSVMIGLFFQTVFYEIASVIPPVIRQDAHISLAICNALPDLVGCEPGVGALTGLEIWKLSLIVGHIIGLLANLLLVAIFSIWITFRLKCDSEAAGIATGVVGVFPSLMLAMTFNVAVNIHSLLGIFGILMLLLLPFSGYVGGRIGKDRLARQPIHKTIYFLPTDEAAQLDWGGEGLSRREMEVLVLLAQGCKNNEIAQRLYISKATVKTHLQHIFAKLGVTNRTAAVSQALAYGLLRQESEGTS